MLSKKMLALGALSLVAGSTAASAQSAQALSLASSPILQRSGADMRGASELRSNGWLVGILAVGVVIFIITRLQRSNDLPTSA